MHPDGRQMPAPAANSKIGSLPEGAADPSDRSSDPEEVPAPPRAAKERHVRPWQRERLPEGAALVESERPPPPADADEALQARVREGLTKTQQRRVAGRLGIDDLAGALAKLMVHLAVDGKLENFREVADRVDPKPRELSIHTRAERELFDTASGGPAHSGRALRGIGR